MSNIYDALSKSKAEGRKDAPGPLTPRGGPPGDFPVLHDPARDRELEALRQRVLLETAGDSTTVLLFTGAVPGEGVSTLSLYFARELATSEQKPVLLVDADFLGSSRALSGTLHSDGGSAPGFSDLLAERVDPSGAILDTEQPNLHFLPAGTEQEAPIELVRPERVRRVLQRLKQHYAFVVFDAGPSLEAPETALLGSSADGVVVVVRANRTRREVVQKAIFVLEKARCRLLGVILNDRSYPIPSFLYRRI